MNKFAERLKELREENNLTQYELSKKVNIRYYTYLLHLVILNNLKYVDDKINNVNQLENKTHS